MQYALSKTHLACQNISEAFIAEWDTEYAKLVRRGHYSEVLVEDAEDKSRWTRGYVIQSRTVKQKETKKF